MELKVGKPFYQWTSQEVVDYFRKLDRKSQMRILGYGGGGILAFFFIFIPAWWSRPPLLNQVAAVRSQIQLGQAQVGQEAKLVEERKSYEAFVKETESKLLSRNEQERLLGILAELSKKAGVTLVSTQPKDLAEKIPAPFDKKYRFVSYQLTVEGGYHALAAFVSEIENYPKLLRVVEFSVTPQEKNPRVHLSQIQILGCRLQSLTAEKK